VLVRGDYGLLRSLLETFIACFNTLERESVLQDLLLLVGTVLGRRKASSDILGLEILVTDLRVTSKTPSSGPLMFACFQRV
jgi:hypothetical protein